MGVSPAARQAGQPWEAWKIDESLTVLHGIQVADLDGDGRDEILTASFEGIHRFDFKGQGQAARWRKVRLAAGAPPVDDKPGAARGSSEVAAFRLGQGPADAGGHRALARPPGRGLLAARQRRRSMAAPRDRRYAAGGPRPGDRATSTATAMDEIVAGWRAGGGGLRLYKATDATGREFKAIDIDPGMPAEGAVAADINGDGKLDLVVIGGRKNQLVWYENLAGKAAKGGR